MTNSTSNHAKQLVSHSPTDKKLRERMLVTATVAIVLAAWVIGYFNNGTDGLMYAAQVIPGSMRVEQHGSLYIGYDEYEQIIGYAALGEGSGYGGQIKVIVGIDTNGDVVGFQVISNKETPGFFRLVESSNYLDQFFESDIFSALTVGEDIDGVSGATLSSEGIAAAVRLATRSIAVEGLNASLPPDQRSIKFGVPEIVLLALFAVGYIANRQKNQKLKLRLRWVTLLTGMIVLGFIYTAPLTIAQIVSLLSGYWPDWHNNLYWYLLIGGILFVTTVEAKNPYCYWFCPFGAFQEVLAQIAGATVCRPRKFKRILVWTPRILALTAIVLGLLFRQPGVVGYEPFAILFDLRGTMLEWLFLVLIIFASLVVYRPFCNFICPIDPVVDFIGAGRRWFREVIVRWRKTTTGN